MYRVEGGEGGWRYAGWRENRGVWGGGRRMCMQGVEGGGRRVKCACHCTVIFPN